MGVRSLLVGQEYWFTYLEDLVQQGEITDKTRLEWEKTYDGYEMVLTFNNPKVAPGDGNIDAMCMFGANADDSGDYSNGGYCVGISYVGAFTPVPRLWAIWATSEQKKAFTQE